MPVPALALFGFLDEQQALAWLASVCVLEDSSPDHLRALWQEAKGKLGPAFPDAGNPDIQGLPPEGAAYVTTLTQQPWVAERLRGIPSEDGRLDFCLVEIDKLIAYQVHIDLARSNHHANGLSQQSDLMDALQVCLPMQQPSEPLHVQEDQRQGSMIIMSRSLNVRTLWRGFAQTGFVGVHVGTGLPFAHVVQLNGRHYLHNGFHRALMLRQRGQTHMPCIVRKVSTPQDAGIGMPGAFDLALLESENPPTLAHFTGGKAAEVVMKNFHRVLHISWAEYAVPTD